MLLNLSTLRDIMQAEGLMNINRSDGWIKIHRKLLYSSIGDDKNAMVLFMLLLTLAHHKDNFASVRFRGKQRYLKSGELAITRTELADFMSWPKSRVKCLLARLVDYQQIANQTDNHTVIISICNWGKYQTSDDQPVDRPPHQPVDRPIRRPPHQPISDQKNKEVKNKEEDSVNTLSETPEKTPNKDIDEMFEAWEATTGMKIMSKVKANRYACSNLLKKHTKDGVLKLLRVVAVAQQTEFAPRISDFFELQSKTNELLVWAKGKTNQQGNSKMGAL